MLSITWLLFLLWMLSSILIISIIDAKNLELNIVYIILGPIAIVYLLSIKSRESGMRKFYKSIEKGFWKKSAWKYYNDVISNIEDSSLTDDDLKKLELYIDAEMSNSKFRTNIYAVILGICVTCMVAFSIYTLTGIDTQEQQRTVYNKDKGIYSSSKITIHSVIGKEKTYDTNSYFKKQIIKNLIIPILIFSFLLLLQTINVTRNSIISNAIKFKLSQGDNEREGKDQGNNKEKVNKIEGKSESLNNADDANKEEVKDVIKESEEKEEEKKVDTGASSLYSDLARENYDHERERKKELEARAGIFIVLIGVVIGFFLKGIDLSLWEKGSTQLEKVFLVTLIIGLIIPVVTSIISLIYFVKVLKTQKYASFNINKVNDNHLKEPTDVASKKILNSFKEIIKSNQVLNTKKAKNFDLGIKWLVGSVVFYAITFLYYSFIQQFM